MNKHDIKISVIIIEDNRAPYSLRCINSVKRQAFQAWEIIYVGNGSFIKKNESLNNIIILDENNTDDMPLSCINSAINKATGTHLFFLSGSSIASPNVLDRLAGLYCQDNNLEGQASLFEKVFYHPMVVIKDNSEYKSISNEYIGNITGKLYDLESINNWSLSISPNSSYGDYLFVDQYLAYYDKIIFLEDVYIYESQNIFPIFCARGNIPENELSLIYNKKGDDVLEYITPNLYLPLLDLINMYSKTHLENYEKHLMLTKEYIQPLYQTAKNNKIFDIVSTVKEYLEIFDQDKDLQGLLLGILGLDNNMFRVMRNNTPEKYLLLERNTPQKTESEPTYNVLDLQQLDELKHFFTTQLNNKKIDDLYFSIQKIKEQLTEMNRENIKIQSREGLELSEEMINYYKDGKLGFKTIIKSLFAWIKGKTNNHKEAL